MGVFKLLPADKSKIVDIHHDFEFVDDGPAGLHIVSIGAVIVGSKGRVLFYGIDSGFFESRVFRRLLKDKSEQSTWLWENMFKHIRVRLAGKSVMSLLEARPKLAAGAAFTIKPEDQELNNTSKIDCVVAVGSLEQIRKALVLAVDGVAGVKTPQVRQWCYYAAHDTVCLNNLFGNMLAKPENWDYHAVDLRLLSDVLGQDHDDYNPEAKLPHHPLFDALAQYQTAEKLRRFVEKSKPEDLGKLVQSPIVPDAGK